MLYCLEFDQVKFYAQTCVCRGWGRDQGRVTYIIVCIGGMGGKGEGREEERWKSVRMMRLIFVNKILLVVCVVNYVVGTYVPKLMSFLTAM